MRLFLPLIAYISSWQLVQGGLPLIINSWDFPKATTKAWLVLEETGSPLDALVEGINQAERDPHVFQVGYGGGPDENGETSLETMVGTAALCKMGF